MLEIIDLCKSFEAVRVSLPHLLALVYHGNERLITIQRVACDESGCSCIRGILEPRDHDAGRLIEDASVVQPRRWLPVNLEKDVTVHDVADDPSRMD